MKTILTLLLAVLTVGAFAATTVSSGKNMVRMNANGDYTTVTREMLRSVKVLPNAVDKKYALHEGATTGTIVWETFTSGTLTTPIREENVNVRLGQGKLYFVTDDTTATINLQF